MYDDQHSRRPGATEAEMAAADAAMKARYPYGCEPAPSGGWNVIQQQEGRHVHHYSTEGEARQVCFALNVEASR